MPSLSEPQDLYFLNEIIEQDTFYSSFTLKIFSVLFIVNNDICIYLAIGLENQELI